MKKIPLTNGGCALVDDIDFKSVIEHTWFRKKGDSGRESVVRTDNGQILSRFILNPPGDTIVDHKDGNPFNNTRENIRECTHAENARNTTMRSTNRSGFRGGSLA